MEITLEKIELVKDRTGVTYKEAKDALEAADGSVVDAIINIEESGEFNAEPESEKSAPNNALFDTIRKTVAKGNMSRIIVRKGDEILINVPLTAGLVGAVVAPWGVIFGIIAAAGFNCKVEFVNDKGEITDVNGKVKAKYGKAKIRGREVYGKGQDTVDKILESDFYSDLKSRGDDAVGRIRDSELYSDLKDKGGDVIDDLKEKADGFDPDKVRESLDSLMKKGSGIFRKSDKGEEIPVESEDIAGVGPEPEDAASESSAPADDQTGGEE